MYTFISEEIPNYNRFLFTKTILNCKVYILRPKTENLILIIIMIAISGLSFWHLFAGNNPIIILKIYLQYLS